MTPPAIVLRGVERTYDLGGGNLVHALRGVDITVQQGEFVAIIGPSGSGKSTLMYLLGCLDQPTRGSYQLCGEEVAGLDDERLSRIRNRRIGYVFQSYQLLVELDAVDNAALGLAYAGASRAERRASASALLERTGLGNRLHHTPRELSGGQQQRVAIARGLAADPEIVLADEPTGNLDQSTGADIMRLLRELHADGRTIILVTHDEQVAKQADRTIRIVDGLVVPGTDAPGAASAVPAVTPRARPPAPAATKIALADTLRMAFREGLLAHRLRTLLTALGIVFGVAAVIAMTAITEGGKQRQLDLIRQIGRSNITVRNQDLDGVRLLRARRLNPAGTTLEDLSALRDQVPGIVAACAWKQIRAEVRIGDVIAEGAQSIGVTGDLPAVADVQVAHGRFLLPRDDERWARVCVLGSTVAQRLGKPDAEALGQVVIVGDEPFAVIGVMTAKDYGTSDIADAAVVDRNLDVYLPLASVHTFFPKPLRDSPCSALSLRMDSDDTLLARSQEVGRIIAARHDGAADHTVVVPLEALKQAQRTKEVFNVIIAVIAAISLVVGGIGIMNIMLASVTERTREIGVRRAVGASQHDILAQFLAESVLISAVGAVAGVLGGIAAGLLVQASFGFPVAFSLLIGSLAVATALGVGVGFGLYPAWKAARMDPVEALRG